MKRRDKFIPTDEAGNFLSGQALYDVARDIGGDTLVLAFSRGKDSLAVWLELRDQFKIIPYYCYMVPGGLSYERDSLDYYEQFFGVHIIRFVHPIFWKNMNDFVFQTPERVKRIRTLNYPSYEQSDLARIVGETHGLEGNYTAFGYRAADDPRRGVLVNREGPLGYDNFRYFWPIWDWKVDQVSERVKDAGLRLPVDYDLWGRTNTAIHYQFSSIVRDELPEDWERLCFWYPLLEAEMFRYEQIEA